MYTPHPLFKIRCRAIILHEEKLLVVKHRPESDYYALPGGHLEPGESLLECVAREIVEELGVQPEIRRLLYIHTFEDKDKIVSMEFFFEVTNSIDFINLDGLERTHAFELAEIKWAVPADGLKIRPEQVTSDFAKGALLADAIRYTKG